MTRHGFPTLNDATQMLEAGKVSAATLVEEALSRARDGEGPRAFTALHSKSARDSALAMDALRKVGRAPSRFAGIPVTVKDLFDEQGIVTRAGSRALDRGPAPHTAPAVMRLIRHGFVVLGRTNMSEFAFSGLGVNPHYGTPLSPWDRETGRLPGGSSSGAAVAAADGMGFGGLGTDTGGSCRIPAALCGVVGFKPSAHRVPLEGAFPLSSSLDSIGPIARSVRDCQILDAVISGADEVPNLIPAEVAGLRLGVLHTVVEEGLTGEVARPYGRALARLEAAGARISDLSLPALERLPTINRKGGLTAAEAIALHEALIAERRSEYDPRILSRIERGMAMSAADYLAVMAARRELQAECAAQMEGFDAVICPTVPIPPPSLAEVEEEAEYGRLNLLLLRNTAIANLLDICAISLPCHQPGDAPAGLMLMAPRGMDARLFAIAAGVERLL
ncbi:amidase [Sabulicella rubraurantiaca]|uniref:amidase n=1 Tax=Sabulicella rubraurantiaca TaxID=2811429 RepID=UPI001A957D6B|nr:amidase [Sabulicella rubraurantiaca]